jgi:RNase P protein component
MFEENKEQEKKPPLVKKCDGCEKYLGKSAFFCHKKALAKINKCPGMKIDKWCLRCGYGFKSKRDADRHNCKRLKREEKLQRKREYQNKNYIKVVAKPKKEKKEKEVIKNLDQELTDHEKLHKKVEADIELKLKEAIY